MRALEREIFAFGFWFSGTKMAAAAGSWPLDRHQMDEFFVIFAFKLPFITGEDTQVIPSRTHQIPMQAPKE